MKVLFGLIYLMDSSMHFMYIFLPCALIVLAVLHRFMKKHEKIWSLLCTIPMLVYIVFIINGYYAKDPERTIYRYAAFGIVALLIMLWGLAVLLKRSFKAYTVIVILFSTVILLLNIISIWAIWLEPNVTNCSHLGWTKSYEEAINALEKYYVLNDWKEIDYDKIREELIPKVREAEADNDEDAYVYALYELKYEFGDGHVAVYGDIFGRDRAIAKYAGNDYGFSMFRADSGEIIAVLVDEESDCYKQGIHNGTVITKWNGVPVEEAAAEVKCIDRSYEFQTIENIHIAQPIFLAGLGGDELTVTYIDESGKEETARLLANGEYIHRRTEALSILFGSSVTSTDNYSTSMLDEHVGYLRITEEEYSLDPFFITKCTIGGYSREMYDDLNSRLEEMKKQGMDRLIIDVRNNSGGNGFESRTVASMFTSNPVPYYLALPMDGKYKVIVESKDIETSGTWSNIPVVVLVNGQTASAGEEIPNYLKNSENVTIMGNTTTWGDVQGTGGVIVLSDSKYEIDFPITPTVGDDLLPAVDTKADRKSRLMPDYMIEYSIEEAIELFENPNEDMVLKEALIYINKD